MNFMAWTADQWGVCVASISLILTIATAWLAWLISATAVRNDICFQIRGWSDQVIALLGDALGQMESKPPQTAFIQIATKAEALADSGRGKLPNTSGAAYGGARHQAIDLVLVFANLCRAYNQKCGTIPPQQEADYRHALICIRRAFVDLVDRVTDLRKVPRRSLRSLVIFVTRQESKDLWALIPGMTTGTPVVDSGRLSFNNPDWRV